MRNVSIRCVRPIRFRYYVSETAIAEIINFIIKDCNKYIGPYSWSDYTTEAVELFEYLQIKYPGCLDEIK